MATGYAAALALHVRLWGARRDGVGCDCDISLFETAMDLNMYVSTWHLSRGYEPERIANSAHPSIVPFQNFATARRVDRDRLRQGQVLRPACAASSASGG